MTETLILRQAPGKMMWVLVGSVAFVILGVWMILYLEGSRRSPEMIRFWGFLSVGFFGWTGIGAVLRSLKPTELVLQPNGFQIRRNRQNPVVPWGDVERFFIASVKGTKLVSYVLRPEAWNALCGRAAFNASFSLTGAHGQVPAYLDRGPEEVCELLEEWRKRHGSA